MEHQAFDRASLASIVISPRLGNDWERPRVSRNWPNVVVRWLSILPELANHGPRGFCRPAKKPLLYVQKQAITPMRGWRYAVAGLSTVQRALGRPIGERYASSSQSKYQTAMILLALIALPALLLATPPAVARGKYVVKPVAEKKVKELPNGPLYWRVENFPTLAQAQAAIVPDHWNPNTVSNDVATSLAVEVAGKAWLLTLGPKGGATPGGAKVAEIGPVPPITAPEYLLRVNYGSGPPGATTPQHSHPGSEAFYVVSGQLGQKTPNGVNYVEAGHTMNGHSADMPMEVFNSGTTELAALIMFVVDATKPFSTPAQLH